MTDRKDTTDRTDMTEPNPCITLNCRMQKEPIAVCKDHCCPYHWQREGREDRAKRDASDRAASKPGNEDGLPDT